MAIAAIDAGHSSDKDLFRQSTTGNQHDFPWGDLGRLLST